MLNIHTTLNSNLILLIPVEMASMLNIHTTLNSNLILLILNTSLEITFSGSFKFQSDSINTKMWACLLGGDC